MVLQELLKGYRIVLASGSPRRNMLLKGLDIDFDVVVKPDISEEFPAFLSMMEIPVYLAEFKSGFYNDLISDKTLVITADTIVWHRDQLVGKPEDMEDARRILQGLSGDMHEVVTGVCIRSVNRMAVFSSYSKVFFRKLTDEEIGYYLENYRPFDKAGAYGIQEWIGYIGIEKIEGSFYNVMGLPVQQLYSELISYLKVN